MSVPRDPTTVLALKITEKTYYHYLTLPAKTHHKKETVLGSYIVVPVDGPSWGWLSKETFRDLYTPIERWSRSRYTLCFSK